MDRKAMGHFGTYVNAAGHPMPNDKWDAYLDLLGVALSTKPTSISLAPSVFTEMGRADVVQKAREKGVCFIEMRAFDNETTRSVKHDEPDIEPCIYFKEKNARKAILIALLHWSTVKTTIKTFRKCNNDYVIGKSFGYPDRDIEALTYYDVLTSLTEKERARVWETEEVRQNIESLHAAFRRNKVSWRADWREALFDTVIDKWMFKLERKGAIQRV